MGASSSVPSTEPTLYQKATGAIASAVNSVKNAVTPKAAQPLLSDADTADALNTPRESPGTTMTGGRRRTRKARKGRKTRRGHRKH